MRTILFAAVLALGAVSGCSRDKAPAADQSSEQTAEQKFPTMTLDEVEKAIAANEATPVDCNGDRMRKKLGVVPGAVLVSDEESYDPSELPADKTRKLIFYCGDAS